MAELGDKDGATIDVAISNDADGVPVFTLVGELDLSNVDQVRGKLNGAINADPKKVVFDLAGLGFMDSSGIALLLDVAETTETVELHHTSPIIRRIIDVTGLEHVLRIIS